MWSYIVVKIDYPIYGGPCLTFRFQFGVIQPLCLKYPIYTLRYGILIWVSIFCHAYKYPIFQKPPHIVPAAVLAAPVGMMYQTFECRPGSCRYGHHQRPQGPLRVEVVMHSIPDNLMSIGVGYQRQVHKLFPITACNLNVGDVADPYLVRAAWNNVLDKIGPLFQPMPGVGGEHAVTATLDKQPALSKDFEKPVPAYLMTVVCKDDLQLPAAQMWHVLTNKLDFADDGCVVYLLGITVTALFPKPLACKAEQSAKSLQAYFRVPLFEFFDCSASTFFDKSIPYSFFRISIITS